MRRIALGATMILVGLASGCLSASRKLEPPVIPEHSLANPAGGSTTTASSQPSNGADPSTATDSPPGPRFGFRNKAGVPDSVMFGNQPESSYRDSPVP